MKEKDITRTLQLVKGKSSTPQNKPSTSTALSSNIDELSISDVCRKAVRHKGILAATTLFVLSFCAIVFLLKGSWYSRENISQFNNFENNSLFFIMDSLVPAEGDNRRSDNKQEYASRAVSALTSDDFLIFLYERAKEDKRFSTILNASKITVEPELTSENHDNLRDFFSEAIKISTPDGGGGILKLKNTGFYVTSFKGPTREYVDVLSSLMSRYMSTYLAQKELEDVQATRQLVKDRLEQFKREIQELNVKRGNLIATTAPLTSDTYDKIMQELQRAKSEMAANKLVELRLGHLFAELEQKVKAFNEGTAADSYATENIDKDLEQTLGHLKNVMQQSASKQFAGAYYQQETAQRHDYDPKTVSAYYIKQQHAFDEARVRSFESALTELKEQINRRIDINNLIDDISKQIITKQKLVDSLESSKVRLDFADFKTLRRVEVFPGSIQFQTILPLPVFALFALVLGTLTAIFAAFIVEIRNPSLTTARGFEELNLPVLGAIPSTKTFIAGESLSFANRDANAMSYVRLAMNLTNILTYMQSKIAAFSASEHSRQSAVTLLNLSTYLANTGRKVLLIESDFQNSYLSKVTGAPDGGLCEIFSSAANINLKPVAILENLHLLSGDAHQLPTVYRLASENFLNLLEELKKEYDYIFIHTSPCLESPEAADVSRYAGVSLVCADASTIRVDRLGRLYGEMQLFLSKYSYFILENAEDDSSKYIKAGVPVRKIKLRKSTTDTIRKAS